MCLLLLILRLTSNCSYFLPFPNNYFIHYEWLRYRIRHTVQYNINYNSGFGWKSKLRYIRIYFNTPTIEVITKDRAAKFVDMLSAIGGTMGLLTGFSVISGIEILYFTWTILIANVSNRMKNILS